MQTQKVKWTLIASIGTIFFFTTILLLSNYLEGTQIAQAAVIFAAGYLAVFIVIFKFVNSNMQEVKRYIETKDPKILKSIIFGNSKQSHSKKE